MRLPLVPTPRFCARQLRLPVCLSLSLSLSCSTGFEKGVTKVRFPLGAAVPVPCPRGGAVCWHNVIHWGGACSKKAPVPRIALAATFKHRLARCVVSQLFKN